MKKTSVKLLSLICAAVLLAAAVCAEGVTLDGQLYSKTEEIYPGLTATDYYLEEGYTYSQNGPQNLRVLEFSPKNSELSLDVVMAGEVGAKKTVTDIVDEFNKTNTENKKVVAAVNGDLWMMAQYHSRVEGSGTVFNGCSDAVVKKELCVPRGTNICDGEIISSQNMQKETPYEEMAESFGITSDGEPLIGNLRVKILLTNETAGTKGFYADGLNRLPADNAIVVYSDKGPTSNYCLDDAYEIVIDCDYDYTVCQNANIKGRVTAISKPGEERPSMKPNRFIITARGSKLSKLEGFAVGDEVSLAVGLSDSYGNTDKWQTVTEAVGGHCVVLRNGEDVNRGNFRYDPMTLIGFKADGTVVILVNDGRQSWYSAGMNRSLFDELGKDLGIDTLFLLDGGGSTTLVELTEEGYALKNRPSDNATEETLGTERAVINAVLISAKKKETATVTMGDIDNDGKINSKDSNLLESIISGTYDECAAADMNSDGKYNSSDSAEMKKILSGS